MASNASQDQTSIHKKDSNEDLETSSVMSQSVIADGIDSHKPLKSDTDTSACSIGASISDSEANIRANEQMTDPINSWDKNINSENKDDEESAHIPKVNSQRPGRKKRVLTDDSDTDIPLSKPKGVKRVKRSTRIDDRRRKKSSEKVALSDNRNPETTRSVRTPRRRLNRAQQEVANSNTPDVLKAISQLETKLDSKFEEIIKSNQNSLMLLKKEVDSVRQEFNDRINGLTKKVESKVTDTIRKATDSKLKQLQTQVEDKTKNIE